MRENTNNKVFFCINDGSPLHGDQMRYCSKECEIQDDERRKARDLGAARTYAYLNTAMLNLCVGQGIRPHRLSGFIHTGHDLMGVALFDAAEIETIGDAEMSNYDAYWRRIPSAAEMDAVTFGDAYDPLKLRNAGIFAFLHEYDIRTEKQIARALRELTEHEDRLSPIEFLNSL